MVSLVMLAIMAGCAVGLYLKGTLAQGIAMIFNALVAGFVAFGFFEIASKYLISYSPGLAPWAPMACFLLLLVLVFAILQAVQMQINKEKIDLGTMPERIGRPVAGVVLGYVVTGYLLVAAAMAPLPSQYPYPRFDARHPNASSPRKALLSPDGFVTGLFGTVSKGSLCPIREPKSFTMLHAGYVDQLHLNRLQGKDVPLMTGSPALDVPRKAGVWFAPDTLRDTEGKPLSLPAGTSLMLVRVQIKKSALKDAPKFTLSQMRLVCGLKGVAGQPLAGQGQAAYPLGYIGAGSHLERKSLDEIVDLSKVQGDPLTMDLGFAVPTSLTPVLLEFKRNNVVQVSATASPEDAPAPVPFGAPAPASQPQAAATEPPAQPAGVEPAGQSPARPAPAPAASAKGKNRGKRKGLSDLSKSVVGDQVPEN
ncbi:MAG: hypothetical protein NTZ17_01570 [Phycisphaerae bacterium]|nr:hypothetical protein [Phycisphaerae bacterium]